MSARMYFSYLILSLIMTFCLASNLKFVPYHFNELRFFCGLFPYHEPHDMEH